MGLLWSLIQKYQMSELQMNDFSPPEEEGGEGEGEVLGDLAESSNTVNSAKKESPEMEQKESTPQEEKKESAPQEEKKESVPKETPENDKKGVHHTLIKQDRKQSSPNLRRSSIATKPKSPKELIIQWMENQVSSKEIEVKNLTNNFKDGQILCALVDSINPNLIHYEALEKVFKKKKNCSHFCFKCSNKNRIDQSKTPNLQCRFWKNISISLIWLMLRIFATNLMKKPT